MGERVPQNHSNYFCELGRCKTTSAFFTLLARVTQNQGMMRPMKSRAIRQTTG